jgi:hypothetical protein
MTWKNVRNEDVKMWKEPVVDDVKAPFLHSLVETQENHETSEVIRPRFKPSTFRIKV